MAAAQAVLRGVLAGTLVLLLISSIAGADLDVVRDVELQPFRSQAHRVSRALEFLGEPLTGGEAARLGAAMEELDEARAIEALQEVLDRRVLVGVHINPESRVKARPGPAKAELHEGGWRVFLVKVHNEAGVTAKLAATSQQAQPMQKKSTGAAAPGPSVRLHDSRDRWLELKTFDERPLTASLSGLALEYRVIQLYSRDRGKREATLTFDVGQGTQDLGFRNEVPLLFHCRPAVKVVLEVLDVDGAPTTAGFVIKDDQGRVFPARSRRLAPDFFFHDQIYRKSGEEVLLPPGSYRVSCTRGPEYRVLHRDLVVPDAATHRESFRLQRWIHMAAEGWFSGDHHVHAAGCSHYEAPSEGVAPADMMRHILGEDVNVGCVLAWGPCWYYQKRFFEGATHELSTDRHLMRYDVEVSGFPSSHSGHLCLLRLKEDDYPGTRRIEDWPSWDLPVLKWARSQGAVVGFAHSGWGLSVPGDDLPSYRMPRFDGIGANEFIVDVVHDACDFISAVDTPIIWELSIWYHTLNSGFTCRISGETDFPCIYGDRVGLGRVYVKLGKDQPLTFDSWVSGLRDGRSYCSDGLSHLYDFRVNNLGVGESVAGGRPSVLAIRRGEELSIRVRAAALLAQSPREDIRGLPLDEKPYWHVERARIGETNRVPVELVVNGRAVERREIVADGSANLLEFQYTPRISSWVALRIFPSSHTNPIFVEIDGNPIRASKRSARWCLEAVDRCWDAKSPRIRESERSDARAAYDVARKAYARILEECHDDLKESE